MSLFCYRHPERIAVAKINRTIFQHTPEGEKEFTIRSPVCQECADRLSGTRRGGAIPWYDHLPVEEGTKVPDSGSASNAMDENAVVDAVCSFLVQSGYTIKSSRSSSERGIDVCAEKSSTGERIHVEAKGATSSRPGSNRSAKPYTEAQVFDRVAKGFYTVFEMQGKAAHGARYVLAVPDSDLFLKYLAPVIAPLEAAGIGVFLVAAGGRVRMLTDFQL